MERLKLNKSGSSKIKISPVLLVVIVAISLAIGFGFGQKGDITGNVVGPNCIPEDELQYFIDLGNSFRNDYYECVQEAWALKFSCNPSLTPGEAIDIS